jgi:dipeptidase
VKNGFIAEKDVDKKNFSPRRLRAEHETQFDAPRVESSSLAAPQSFKLGPDELDYPLSIKPDRKLSVHDVLAIKGDWYEGTQFDLSKGIQAGPWGNPIRFANSSKKEPAADWERSVNMMRSCYVHIA